MIGRTIEQYRIDRLVGQGELGAVYQATDTRQNIPVAIKVMDDDLAKQEVFQKRFLQEARSASLLDHPNIVRVLTYDNKEGVLYLVMEWMTGGGLRDYLTQLRAEGKAMPLEQAVDLVRQLADALHYADQQNVNHRDVRPENISLRRSDNGSIKALMTDFGLARLAETALAGEARVGTLAYLSPEQCSAQKVDRRADIYSLGIVLYELIAGVPPFEPQSINEAVRMHTREKPPSLASKRSGVPLALENMVMQALAKSPNDRYQTAGEFSRTLQKFEVVEDLPTNLPEEAPPVVSRTQLDDAPAPSSSGTMIEVTPDGKPPYLIPLDTVPMSIGRADNANVRLESTKVSREHASINRGADGNYTITDLRSSNGTWLGDQKLIGGMPPETWYPNTPVRVGEFTLRLVTKGETAPNPGNTSIDALGFTQLNAMGMGAESPPTPPPAPVATPSPSAVRPSAAMRPPAPAPAFTPPPPQAPAPPAPPPQPATPAPRAPGSSDTIGVTVDTVTLTVEAGSQVSLNFQVLNQSRLVDHFPAHIYGLPPEWVTEPGTPLYLLPKEKKGGTIIFRPPRLSSSTAGSHPFELHVTTEAQNSEPFIYKGVLNILPFYAFSTELSPKKVKGRGKARLTIENKGNSPGTYTLIGSDRENELNFALGEPTMAVAPGAKETRELHITPQTRTFFGGSKTMPFEIKIDAGEKTGGIQQQMGELVVQSVIPPMLVASGTVALALIGGLAFGAIKMIESGRANAATQAAIALTQVGVNGMTATAASDVDQDGLTCAQELDNKTVCDDPDTDGDGLKDGDEILKYHTTPVAQQDSDGDGLKDGAEVLIDCGNGNTLDPSNPDTDGDGIKDGEDLDPCAKSTPTPTPSATPTMESTIIGSNGDICEGSPPDRLHSETLGVVTATIPLRVRPAPGVNPDTVPTEKTGAKFSIVDRVPQCDPKDRLRWWHVRFDDGIEGWATEGDKRDTETPYYLSPLNLTPTPPPS